MAIGISITDCRSKSGVFTLPFFSGFTGGTPGTFKRLPRCGHTLQDCAPFYQGDPLSSTPDLQGIVQVGDYSTLSVSGFQNFGGFTATWSFTLTPVDNNDGTVTFTCATSVVLSSGAVSGIRLLALGGTGPAQMVNGDTYTALYLRTLPSDCVNNKFYTMVFKRNGGGDIGLTFSQLYYARAFGHQNFADPYTFLYGQWCQSGAGLYPQLMMNYAAFDIPKDCSSMYCWPPTITSGVASCPFRYVELQATATGLTVGTTYTATYQYEWRPLAGGSWSTASISTQTIVFKAGHATQVLPWMTLNHSQMNTGRSGSGKAVEYRLNSVTIV